MKRWILPAIPTALLSSALMLSGMSLLAHALAGHAAAASHELPEATRNFLPASTTPELRAHGASLYLNSCAHCHGADARGDEGPDLHGLQLSDRRIATVIKRGIRGEMPSFMKKHTDEDIGALIAYLRTLE